MCACSKQFVEKRSNIIGVFFFFFVRCCGTSSRGDGLKEQVVGNQDSEGGYDFSDF